MKLKVMLDENAIMPTRAHSVDCGLDLYSRERKTIWPGSAETFDLGVHILIPHGYSGEVDPKSSLLERNLLTAGTVDPDYTGSIKVRLFNLGGSYETIEAGQKIAQLVIKRIITPDLELVTEMPETERGTGGFGSSGKF